MIWICFLNLTIFDSPRHATPPPTPPPSPSCLLQFAELTALTVKNWARFNQQHCYIARYIGFQQKKVFLGGLVTFYQRAWWIKYQSAFTYRQDSIWNLCMADWWRRRCTGLNPVSVFPDSFPCLVIAEMSAFNELLAHTSSHLYHHDVLQIVHLSES